MSEATKICLSDFTLDALTAYLVSLGHRSLCTQQRPMTFDLRGLNSIGRRSISSSRRFSFQSFTNFASNPWRTIITLLVNAMVNILFVL